MLPQELEDESEEDEQSLEWHIICSQKVGVSLWLGMQAAIANESLCSAGQLVAAKAYSWDK